MPPSFTYFSQLLYSKPSLEKGTTVDTQTWTEWIRLRTSDIRAIFPTYTAFTFGILTFVIGHEHLENTGKQR